MIVMLLSLSCTAERMAAPKRLGCGPGMPGQDDAIHAAALDDLIFRQSTLGSVSQGSHPTYYVAVLIDPPPPPDRIRALDRFGDPSISLLARVAAHGWAVKPISDAPNRDSSEGPTLSPGDHVFKLGAICWTGPGEVRLRADDETLTIRQNHDAWAVVSAQNVYAR
jgi:hypothetical protein